MDGESLSVKANNAKAPQNADPKSNETSKESSVTASGGSSSKDAGFAPLTAEERAQKEKALADFFEELVREGGTRKRLNLNQDSSFRIRDDPAAKCQRPIYKEGRMNDRVAGERGESEKALDDSSKNLVHEQRQVEKPQTEAEAKSQEAFEDGFVAKCEFSDCKEARVNDLTAEKKLKEDRSSSSREVTPNGWIIEEELENVQVLTEIWENRIQENERIRKARREADAKWKKAAKYRFMKGCGCLNCKEPSSDNLEATERLDMGDTTPLQPNPSFNGNSVAECQWLRTEGTPEHKSGRSSEDNDVLDCQYSINEGSGIIEENFENVEVMTDFFENLIRKNSVVQRPDWW